MLSRTGVEWSRAFSAQRLTHGSSEDLQEAGLWVRELLAPEYSSDSGPKTAHSLGIGIRPKRRKQKHRTAFPGGSGV